MKWRRHRAGCFQKMTAHQLFFLVLMLAGTLRAAPQIKVDEPRWDFGAVSNGLAITHEFLVRNAGDQVLNIRRVISSCSECLRARVNQTNIPAGGTAKLKCDLDLRLMSGEVSRMVLLDSNDPQIPSLVLELAGIAVPAYRIQPPDINLDLSHGQNRALVEITPLWKLRAPLTQAFCTSTNAVATITRRSINQYDLVLETLKSLPQTNLVYGVTVQSIDSNDPPCKIFCYIHNPPDLELIPPKLVFLSQDEPQRRILWIKQHGATPLNLLDVLAPSDKYRCEIVPEPAGFNYRVNISAWHQKTLSGETNWLTLKMRGKDSQVISVTVPVSVN